MPPLRQRLASLSAARTGAGTSAPPRSACPAPAAGSGQPAVAVGEQVLGLDSRAWLRHLAVADSRAAALLTQSRGINIPPLADWLFLDLETTGLAGGTGTYAFLVGVGQLVPAGFRIHQFFLRELGAERALLEELVPRLRSASLLVTYNGKLFDVPLLETRFRLARIALGLDSLLHLDLLYPARCLWKQRWGSVRLPDLERNLLRHERPDDVPGGLVPQLYFNYLRRGDEEPLRIVFRHNIADLVSLAALAGRLLHLLSRPETSGCDSLEWFGLGRLYERAGHLGRARRLYERALAAGLPVESEPGALLRLALLCKRQRNYHRAVTLWQELARRHGHAKRHTLQAFEEMAICYEHRLGDLDAASEVTRRALSELERLRTQHTADRFRHRRAQARFGHRLRRLTRKAHPLLRDVPDTGPSISPPARFL